MFAPKRRLNIQATMKYMVDTLQLTEKIKFPEKTLGKFIATLSTKTALVKILESLRMLATGGSGNTVYDVSTMAEETT